MAITPGNYTLPRNADVTELLTTYPNEQLLFGYYGALILVAFYTVIFVTMVQRQTGVDAFAAASFATFPIATFMLVVGMINTSMWVISVLLLVAGIGAVSSNTNTSRPGV